LSIPKVITRCEGTRILGEPVEGKEKNMKIKKAAKGTKELRKAKKLEAQKPLSSGQKWIEITSFSH
jgi:hypothetical protein